MTQIQLIGWTRGEMLYQKALYMNVVFGLNVVLGPVDGYEKEKVNKKEKYPPHPLKRKN